MKPEAPLDYAVFQLSPRRSRCELFVSSNGNTERLASGFVKPFVAHLKVAEEKVASDAQSVKLEAARQKSSKTWFTKGTLERFVRFVSTPEVLELVNTSDAEMSQLEAARKIYAEDRGDQPSGGGKSGGSTSADVTKKELLRAIDVRLGMVQHDLTAAFARAAAAGFNFDTVSELQMFADFFGGHRLNEACSKYISLCERRAELISPWKPGIQDGAVRSSYGSDMSIDEDPSSPHPTGPHPAQVQHQGDLSTCQQPKPPSLSFPVQNTVSQESSIEREDSHTQNDVEKETTKDGSSSTEQTELTRTSHHMRRLSVQDRISLFENKQKETSGSGGKPVVRKSVELRRLSSDVSSAPGAVEKAVLRRWSGASDMSIDLSAEKKDTESPLCTPSFSSGLPSKSDEKKSLNLNDTVVSSVKPESRIIPGVSVGRVESGLKDAASFSKSNDSSESSMPISNLSTVEFDGSKDQTHWKFQSTSFIVRADDQQKSEEKLRFPDRKHEVQIAFGDQGKLKGGEELAGIKGGVASETQVTEVKNQGAVQTLIQTSGSKGVGQVEISNWKEQFESRDQLVTQSRSKSPQKTVVDSGQFGGIAGSRIREAFAAHYKGTEKGSFSSQSSKRATGDTEEAGKKESVSSEKISSSHASKVEDSRLQKTKFQKHVSAPEQINKSLQWRDESSSLYGNSVTPFSGKLIMDGQDGSDSFVTPTSEQVQRGRLSKGNQELNDELKIKANELEKLFAELQLPGEQSNSARKDRLADVQGESTASLSYKKPVADITPRLSNKYWSSEPTGSSKNTTKSSADPLITMAESQKYGDAELSFSEGSRGKMYDIYMLKRDAKLREEWGSNRAEKEAKLKTMQDSLEWRTAEMKAKFSGSADTQDSVSSARRRAERLRSFSALSIMKREQKQIDVGDSEDDEDASEFQEQEHLREGGTLNETSFGDGVSKSAPSKKLPSKSSSTSMPRTSAAPAPRSAAKASILSSGKRRMQSENPLVQSVPNLFDLRRENTKPSSAVTKTARPQERNYSRSKSTSEEAPIVKERSRRSQSLRKSSANLSESREISPLDSDDPVLSPLKFEKDVGKNVETKPFLRKGSRADFVATSSIMRKNTSMTLELPPDNEEENNDLTSETEDMRNTARAGEEDEFETMSHENNNGLDNGKPRLSLESEKLNSGSENGDAMRSFSQVDQALGAELPSMVQDWAAESPLSWNSRAQHLFSYPHEMSDIEASVDSRGGSPASLNSHSLSQIETDAARMRKKWGTAQKPMWAVHSSNNISRKDMTKGFKRLLKFGRKSRGAENLVDWISATTSEGDDDVEDGRDTSNRLSEDTRKSRMRFTQGQPSDDSFTESEFFNEQVQSSHSSIPTAAANFKLREDHTMKAPRSFFSLSTFRSKGSESRPK